MGRIVPSYVTGGGLVHPNRSTNPQKGEAVMNGQVIRTVTDGHGATLVTIVSDGKVYTVRGAK